MAMRPHDDPRKKREPTSGTKAKPHGLSGIKAAAATTTTADTPAFSADDRETTVADHDLQKTLAGMSPTRRDTAGPFKVPPGWGFHELSLLDYWTRVLDLQRAQLDGTDALSLALSAYDLESFGHLDWLRERFQKRYGKDPEFKKAMLEAREVRSSQVKRR